MVQIKYPLEGWHPTGSEGWIEWSLALKQEILNLLEAGKKLEATSAVECDSDWAYISDWRIAVENAKKVIEGKGQ